MGKLHSRQREQPKESPGDSEYQAWVGAFSCICVVGQGNVREK